MVTYRGGTGVPEQAHPAAAACDPRSAAAAVPAVPASIAVAISAIAPITAAILPLATATPIRLLPTPRKAPADSQLCARPNTPCCLDCHSPMLMHTLPVRTAAYAAVMTGRT
ncbi:hypothetical protein GCM10010507_11990 [Streptomyces cinnamoneus]|uniref:Uncharacterized protein n=1 Tax=Streptomyces cinnamoneus TaxID=53446 RepID=A0A918WFP9_STRCJ|nr:hypothetical protein GCM10010507_11990 [Streptomyces cinnamoneus]